MTVHAEIGSPGSRANMRFGFVRTMRAYVTYTCGMSKTQGRGSARRTYSIGEQTVLRFEALVPAGQRSQLVDELLNKRMEEIEADRLRTLIHEGLRYMADVYVETGRDWASLDGEGWPLP